MDNEKCIGIIEEYCYGACEQLEKTHLYNTRIKEALESLKERPSYIVFDKGLQEKQSSCIVVEKGSLVGMGYIPADLNSENIETIKKCLQPMKENAVIRQLLNRYLEQYSHKVVFLNH
jgi:DNA polymerase-3 subunit epsilon